MFIIHWMFDKLGYMPKISVDAGWSFPPTKQDNAEPECEQPAKKKVTPKKPAAKQAVRKTVRKKV
jgi:hypothetical protein